MQQVAEDSNANQKASEINSVNKILQGIRGWSLRGWLAKILETIVIVVAIVIIICLAVDHDCRTINCGLVRIYMIVDRNNLNLPSHLMKVENFQMGELVPRGITISTVLMNFQLRNKACKICFTHKDG